MEPILSRIQAEKKHRPKAWCKIADHLLAHPEEVLSMKLKAFSTAVDVSEGSVVNFVYSLGFDDFVGFKVALAQSLQGIRTNTLYTAATPEDTGASVLHKIASDVNHSLQATEQANDGKAIEALAKILAQSKGRVMLFGFSTAAHLAEIFAGYLTRMHIPAMALTDPRICEAAGNGLKKGDIAIAITYSGRTEEIANAFATAKKSGVHTACITSFEGGRIAKYCQTVIPIRSDEAGEGAFPFVSRIVQLTVIDAICALIPLYKKKTK